VAGRCLDDSTIIIGIDKDAKAGYAYVMTHADGAATRIYGLGKVPQTFNDPIYFRWAGDSRSDPLNGD
jgi:hypothetical protein